MNIETQNKIKTIIEHYNLDSYGNVRNYPIHMVALYKGGNPADGFEYWLDVGYCRLDLYPESLFNAVKEDFDREGIYYLEQYLGEYNKAINIVLQLKKAEEIINIFGEIEK